METMVKIIQYNVSMVELNELPKFNGIGYSHPGRMGISQHGGPYYSLLWMTCILILGEKWEVGDEGGGGTLPKLELHASNLHT